MKHINRFSIIIILLFHTISANAQFDLITDFIMDEIEEAIIDGIKDAIISSAKDGARGDITAEVDNKVINEAASKARKRGVRTAISNKNGVNINNVDGVLTQVCSDYKSQMSSARSTLKPTSTNGCMFKQLADGQSYLSSQNLIVNKITTNIYGTNNISRYGNTDVKLCRILGDSVANAAFKLLNVEQRETLLNDIAKSSNLRNAIRQRPTLVAAYAQTINTPLSKDIVFLSFLDSGAMKYFSSNVMLEENVAVLPLKELTFTGNQMVEIKHKGKPVANVIGNSITVVDNTFLNYALLPNKIYNVEGFLYHTDNLGRVVIVEGNVYENKTAFKDKNLTKAFVNAKERYSGKVSEKIGATYIIPMEYGGVTYGINSIPLTKEQVNSQKQYYKYAKKNKGTGFHTRTILSYIGASEIPIDVSYQ